MSPGGCPEELQEYVDRGGQLCAGDVDQHCLLSVMTLLRSNSYTV